MSAIAKVTFADYATSVICALDLICAADLLPQKGIIALKPNLTNASAPPVTTDVGMINAVLQYCRRHTSAEVVIAEGSGSGETADAFRANGYEELAEKAQVRLIDLNAEETVLLKRPEALSKKKFYLPKILLDAFVISVPVLKDHSMVTMTAALKNMFGIAPKPHYALTWNKSKLHFPSTHKSIVDVCLYKSPALSIIDASVVLTGSHLSGTVKRCNCIIAGEDPVAVDATAASLLGHDPTKIKYLRLANGLLGSYENMEHIEA